MHKVKVDMAVRVAVEKVQGTVEEAAGKAEAEVAEGEPGSRKPSLGAFAKRMKGGMSRKSSTASSVAPAAPSPTSSIASTARAAPSPSPSLTSLSTATAAVRKKDVKKFGSGLSAFKSKMGAGKTKKKEEEKKEEPKEGKLKVRLFFQERVEEPSEEEILARIGQEAEARATLGMDQIAQAAKAMRRFVATVEESKVEELRVPRMAGLPTSIL